MGADSLADKEDLMLSFSKSYSNVAKSSYMVKQCSAGWHLTHKNFNCWAKSENVMRCLLVSFSFNQFQQFFVWKCNFWGMK